LVYTTVAKNWFHYHFVAEVKRHLKEVLKFSREELKALLIFDSAPPRPELSSKDGKIKCLTLPSNTTALIQPMDPRHLYGLEETQQMPVT
jgi:hypothetical protein